MSRPDLDPPGWTALGCLLWLAAVVVSVITIAVYPAVLPALIPCLVAVVRWANSRPGLSRDSEMIVRGKSSDAVGPLWDRDLDGRSDRSRGTIVSAAAPAMMKPGRPSPSCTFDGAAR